MKENATYQQLIGEEASKLQNDELSSEEKRRAFLRIAEAVVRDEGDDWFGIPEEVAALACDLDEVPDAAVLRLEYSSGEYYVARSVEVPSGTAYVVNDVHTAYFIQSEELTRNEIQGDMQLCEVHTNRVDWEELE